MIISLDWSSIPKTPKYWHKTKNKIATNKSIVVAAPIASRGLVLFHIPNYIYKEHYKIKNSFVSPGPFSPWG